MGGGPSGKSEIDRDEARAILKKLQANLEDLRSGPGSAAEVQSNGNVTSAQLGAGSGMFATGMHLGANTARAYSTINSQYTALVTSYEQVINSLKRAVGEHDKKEEQNTATANSVNTNATSARPTTRNTQAF
ncbi:hypothetical protein [Actinomadura flavalba]|uniref:hypothetical protein n=1 Tax=Actinomadura flavalba TaxID=1120938 RepID=UPI00035C36EC|nr:hypothetical protein [Actinomadura flavalba]